MIYYVARVKRPQLLTASGKRLYHYVTQCHRAIEPAWPQGQPSRCSCTSKTGNTEWQPEVPGQNECDGQQQAHCQIPSAKFSSTNQQPCHDGQPREHKKVLCQKSGRRRKDPDCAQDQTSSVLAEAQRSPHQCKHA